MVLLRSRPEADCGRAAVFGGSTDVGRRRRRRRPESARPFAGVVQLTGANRRAVWRTAAVRVLKFDMIFP